MFFCYHNMLLVQNLRSVEQYALPFPIIYETTMVNCFLIKGTNVKTPHRAHTLLLTRELGSSELDRYTSQDPNGKKTRKNELQFYMWEENSHNGWVVQLPWVDPGLSPVRLNRFDVNPGAHPGQPPVPCLCSGSLGGVTTRAVSDCSFSSRRGLTRVSTAGQNQGSLSNAPNIVPPARSEEVDEVKGKERDYYSID